ncbi:hypothetical protein [Dickeya ananatis]|uniref:hypothetical protein n=1 Tax=Dickeya ananatis TaxID=3061286 RepID=UPI00388F4025
MSKSGRLVEVRVNGSVVAVIKTETAVAADYIMFIEATVKALAHSASLEREANASGRTTEHPNFNAFGSLPITDPKGL